AISILPSRRRRNRSTNSATPAPSQYSTPAASTTSGLLAAASAATRASFQSVGSVVASRRPVNARMRRPSGVSVIASAAIDASVDELEAVPRAPHPTALADERLVGDGDDPPRATVELDRDLPARLLVLVRRLLVRRAAAPAQYHHALVRES